MDSSCVMCGCAEETKEHLFFGCEFSRVIWYCCSLQLDATTFVGIDFHACWSTIGMRCKDEQQREEIMQKVVFVL